MSTPTIEPPAGYRLMLPGEKPDKDRGDLRYRPLFRKWGPTNLVGRGPVSRACPPYATKIIPPANHRLMLPTERPDHARGDLVLRKDCTDWTKSDAIGFRTVAELMPACGAYAYATKLPAESPLESARQTAVEALKSGVGVKEAMNAHCEQQGASDFLEDASKAVKAADESGKLFPPDAGEVLSEVAVSPPSPAVSACLSAMSDTLEPQKTPPAGYRLLLTDENPHKERGDLIFDVNFGAGWREYVGSGHRPACGAAYARKITPENKPPLGLKPRKIAEEHRAIEVLEAMHRFVECGRSVPIEWGHELLELLDRLRGAK